MEKDGFMDEMLINERKRLMGNGDWYAVMNTPREYSPFSPLVLVSDIYHHTSKITFTLSIPWDKSHR